MTKQCAGCLIIKPTDQFYRHAKRGHQDKCKLCKAEYNRKHYVKDKDSYLARAKESNAQKRIAMRELLDVLKGHPCMDCGGRFPPCAMDFDHVRGKKRTKISEMQSCSKKQILAEIAKCELVCANCHRIRTESRRRSGIDVVSKAV